MLMWMPSVCIGTFKLKRKRMQFQKRGFRLPIDGKDCLQWAELAPADVLPYHNIDEILYDDNKNVVRRPLRSEITNCCSWQ